MRNPARILAVSLTIAILLVLMIFTYARFRVAPYPGFGLGPPNATIYRVMVEGNLQPGDRLVAVDGRAVSPLLADLSQPLLEQRTPGTVVALLVERDGQLVSVDWVWPGRTRTLLLARASSVWFLSYILWGFGALTVLLIRPRDRRWWLLIGYYYITALWLFMGDLSEFRIWNSGILLRFFIWLSLPIYLHLHWVFPKPLRPLSKLFWPVLYAVGLSGAMAALFQLIPSRSHIPVLLAGVAGSILLIVMHFVLQRSQRRAVRVLLIVGLFSLLPLALGLGLSILTAETWSGLPATLFGLMALPLAYFYIAYRRQPGWPEVRANRFLSGFLFLLLMASLATLCMSIPVIAARPDLLALDGIFTAVAVTLITMVGYRRFRSFLERRLWGVATTPETLVDLFTTRISGSLDRRTLANVLQEEVMPTLLIGESALVTFSGPGDARWLYADGVSDPPATAREVDALARADAEDAFGARSPTWAKLVLPLRVEDDLLGLWLLGRHDPDDVYGNEELRLLKTVAAQTAVALSNIQKTEQLLALYAANIRRHEEERARLARYLHDDVLNALSSFVYFSQEPSLQHQLVDAYEDLVNSIRGTVSDLRPAMLTYGLWTALDELAEWLRQHADSNGPVIYLDVPRTGVRYREEVENQLFRVVQQAAHNALRHAAAGEIRISGELAPSKATLVVRDDGMGFESGTRLDPAHLLRERHFGLVNMLERCTLIGAKLQIESASGHGTQVRVTYDGGSAAARQAPLG